jgi:hypothetical protein
MWCLNNLLAILSVFERFVSVTHTKRKEFFVIQKRIKHFTLEMSKIREGHLKTCIIEKNKVCKCKEYIYTTSKEIINDIVDIIEVPYAMNFGYIHQ